MAIKIGKPKRGRPATGRDPVVSYRPPEAQRKAIEAHAKAHKITRSAALESLVDKGLAKP